MNEWTNTDNKTVIKVYTDPQNNVLISTIDYAWSVKAPFGWDETWFGVVFSFFACTICKTNTRGKQEKITGNNWDFLRKDTSKKQ